MVSKTHVSFSSDNNFLCNYMVSANIRYLLIIKAPVTLQLRPCNLSQNVFDYQTFWQPIADHKCQYQHLFNKWSVIYQQQSTSVYRLADICICRCWPLLATSRPTGINTRLHNGISKYFKSV